MSDIAAQKAAARKVALQVRKVAHAGYSGRRATDNLLGYLAGHLGKPMSGYMTMRSEIDCLRAMAELSKTSAVAVPVVVGKGQPLEFHRWQPNAAMQDGAYGALIPRTSERITPMIFILPLLAFDTRGYRLGYGGGYYDRTLAILRAQGPTLAVGFAYAAQQIDTVPREATDQKLDALVTEVEILEFPSFFPKISPPEARS